MWREEVGEENCFYQAGSLCATHRIRRDVVEQGLQAQRWPRLGCHPSTEPAGKAEGRLGRGGAAVEVFCSLLLFPL